MKLPAYPAKFSRAMPKDKLAYKSILFVASLFFLCLGADLSLHAQGDLMVFPKRIVFEGNRRSNELNLANIGKDTARYNISFVQYRMNENGSFTEITVPDEGQNFADKFLRYYPRTVVLAPKESQVVKVQLTRTELLKPGEYRSHIYFRAIPNSQALGEEDRSKDTTSVSVRLVPIFGITIPAIIRVGENNTKVSLSELNFSFVNDTIPSIQVTFNRTGNMSIYGDLTVTHISSQGKKTEVGKANGIGVYTPNALRHFQLQLSKTTGANFHDGKLNVIYSSQNDARIEKLAESELYLK